MLLLTGIVDDVLDYTANVSVTLSIVESTELGRGLVQARVGRYFQPLVYKTFFMPAHRFDMFEAIVEIFAVGGGLTEDGATALALVANNSTHGDWFRVSIRAN